MEGLESGQASLGCGQSCGLPVGMELDKSSASPQPYRQSHCTLKKKGDGCHLPEVKGGGGDLFGQGHLAALCDVLFKSWLPTATLWPVLGLKRPTDL